MKTIGDLRSRVITDMTNTSCLLIISLIGSHPLTDFLEEWYKEDKKDKVIPLTEENVICLMQKDIFNALKSVSRNEKVISLIYLWKYRFLLWILDDQELLDIEYTNNELEIFNKIIEKYNIKIDAKE